MCYNAITTSYQYTRRGQICDEHVSKFEEHPSDENDGNVGGSNFTPCLIKPLIYVELLFVLKSCVSYVMNCN